MSPAYVLNTENSFTKIRDVRSVRTTGSKVTKNDQCFNQLNVNDGVKILQLTGADTLSLAKEAERHFEALQLKGTILCDCVTYGPWSM